MKTISSLLKTSIFALEASLLGQILVLRTSNFRGAAIAILTVTSPIVINVPTRGLLAVETKDSFVLWLAKFKYQKNCL